MKTQPNIAEPDAFYAALVSAHVGLSEADSHDLNARLVLLLANQLGEADVLLQCIAAARDGVAEDLGAAR